jgi:hypothetical protein
MELRCKSWSCPRCRPRRQRRLRFQALAGKPITFITLTCKPDLYEAPGDAARDITKAWRAARRAIEAKLRGRKGEYLTVVEATERGWPHLHILTTRRWIDQRWLSALWKRLTGAHIVDIRRVKNARMAASYVAKYLGKAPHQFMKCKRYYFTRGYLPKQQKPEQEIDWSTASHEECKHGALNFVVALQMSGYKRIIARDGFWLFLHPPPGDIPASVEPAGLRYA